MARCLMTLLAISMYVSILPNSLLQNPSVTVSKFETVLSRLKLKP
jgi:hypothetical protein